MAAATNYTVNKFLVDYLFRAQSGAAPTALYFGLIVANKGVWAPSTVYAINDQVVPIASNGRVYRCTTGGTSATGGGPVWPTTNGGTVTETGGVVWVEQTPTFQSGVFGAAATLEASYTNYVRTNLAPSLTNWSGTNSLASTAVSTGTTGTTSNLAAVTFAAPGSAQTGLVVGMFVADGSVVGAGNSNMLVWSVLTNPKTINNGDAAPTFPVNAFTFTYN